MKTGLDQALFDPALWRLDAARRRRQLEELQQFLGRAEAEFTVLHRQVKDFMARYEQQLGPGWAQVEALHAELMRALDTLARAQGAKPPPYPVLRQRRLLPSLPPAPAWPTAPADESARVAPSLKDLHRRAAMRLHPDRADSEADRHRREGLMRDANLAYASQDRAALEAMLIAAGEAPHKLGGFDVSAHWQWLERCETQAQGRLRLVQAHLLLLRQHPMTALAEAVERAQARGLDALALMAARLASQAAELSQQIYIGARLNPSSALAQAFLAQWCARWTEVPSVQPVHSGALKGDRATNSAS